jgi:hypothetical protein
VSPSAVPAANSGRDSDCTLWSSEISIETGRSDGASQFAGSKPVKFCNPSPMTAPSISASKRLQPIWRNANLRSFVRATRTSMYCARLLRGGVGHSVLFLTLTDRSASARPAQSAQHRLHVHLGGTGEPHGVDHGAARQRGRQLPASIDVGSHHVRAEPRCGRCDRRWGHCDA